ncbi:hypothetical protein XFF7766_810009 [Xanthomonas citri pv. fuscans]|nr:hypothetical protein XFF7766_810009 [Xanthomonas citri pv. fuscans]
MCLQLLAAQSPTLPWHAVDCSCVPFAERVDHLIGVHTLDAVHNLSAHEESQIVGDPVAIDVADKIKAVGLNSVNSDWPLSPICLSHFKSPKAVFPQLPLLQLIGTKKYFLEVAKRTFAAVFSKENSYLHQINRPDPQPADWELMPCASA